MERTDRLSKLLRNTPLNAFAGWTIVFILSLISIVNLMDGRLTWFILVFFVICIIIAPAMLLRKPYVMPSWYFIVLAILPIIGSTTAYYFFSTSIPFYISIATIAMLLVAEINWFTSVRMNYRFAIVLVMVTTLAISGLLYLIQWFLDMNMGTMFLLDGRTPEEINAHVMYRFMYATIAGVVAGMFFGWYLKKERNNSIIMPPQGTLKTPEYPVSLPPAPIHRLFNMSHKKQKQITRTMQAGLLLLFIIGMILKDLPTALNAIMGLGVTLVPAFIKHKYSFTLDPGLTLWITMAIFLDALGTFAFYDSFARWDHITHTVSASIVAAAGYVLIRAIDIYTDEIYIPKKVMFLFILLFILAIGVLWEILEFITDEIADELGVQAVLIQHGIHDTMKDMSFNLIGAILAASWGTAYLSDISYRLAHKFDVFFSKNE